MSKQAGQTQTTSTTGPNTFQRPYLEGLFEQAQTLYGGEQPQYFPGSTVAPFAPAQQEGFAHAERAAPMAAELSSDFAFPTTKRLLNASDVGNNPFVQGQIEAATRPIHQQLLEHTLPALRQGAVATGNRGSTAEALASSQAVERTSRAAGDTAANILGNAYNSGLSTELGALNQIPQQQQSLFAPGRELERVGGAQQGQQQAGINEAIERFRFNQNVPFEQLADYARLVSTPFGGESNSMVTGTPPGGVEQVLSLILGGAAVAPGLIEQIRRIFGGGQPAPGP